jgi:hypothetical protein
VAADLEVNSALESALRALECGVDLLVDVDLSGVGSAELVDALRRTERVARRLPAARNAQVAEVEQRGLPGQHGCRSAAAFLRQLVNCSAPEAGSWVAQAEDLVGTRSLSTGEVLPPRLPRSPPRWRRDRCRRGRCG